MSQLCLQPSQLDPEDEGNIFPRNFVTHPCTRTRGTTRHKSQSGSPQRSHLKFWIQDL